LGLATSVLPTHVLNFRFPTCCAVSKRKERLLHPAKTREDARNVSVNFRCSAWEDQTSCILLTGRPLGRMGNERSGVKKVTTAKQKAFDVRGQPNYRIRSMDRLFELNAEHI